MKKFLVLYMAPSKSMEEWMKQDESVRKADEEKMKKDWDAWMAEHADLLAEGTAGAGATKRVSESGIEAVKNDVMMFSIAVAQSHDEVAQAFVNHPHFGIPGAWIDIMPANFLPGMES